MARHGEVRVEVAQRWQVVIVINSKGDIPALFLLDQRPCKSDGTPVSEPQRLVYVDCLVPLFRCDPMLDP